MRTATPWPAPWPTPRGGYRLPPRAPVVVPIAEPTGAASADLAQNRCVCVACTLMLALAGCGIVAWYATEELV